MKRFVPAFYSAIDDSTKTATISAFGVLEIVK